MCCVIPPNSPATTLADLIEDGQSLYPVEIKKAKNPAVKQRNLKVLDKSEKEVGPAIILCMTEELVPVNNDIWLCPVGAI